MRRVWLGALLCAVVAGVGVSLFFGSHQNSVPGTRLAPENAAVFFELPDVQKSRKSWVGTDLAHMLEEPSVQRFLSRPLSRLFKNYHTSREALEYLRPNAIFFSAISGNDKAWLLGLQCSCDLKSWRQNVEGAIANAYGCRLVELSDKLPERASGGASPVVYAWRIQNWLLFGQDAASLRSSVERFSQKSAGLEQSPLFRECSARIPAAYDFVTFFRGEALSTEALPWKAPGDAENVRAVIAATTIDGARLRDTVFTAERSPKAKAPLDGQSFSVAGPEALLFGTFQLDLMHFRDLADQLSGKFAIAEAAKGYLGEVTSAGVNLDELSGLVQTVNFVVDRRPESNVLSLFFTASLRDPVRFGDLAEKLLSAKFPGQVVKRQVAGLASYALRLNEGTSVVFGIYGNHFYLATNEEDFAEQLKRARGQTVVLASSKQFQAARQLVAPATDVFVYVDSKDLFERVYPAGRPILVLGCALLPYLNEYLDPNTLPEMNEISRHLSPIVFSRHRVENGMLDESVGPITGYQASIVGLSAGFALGLFETEG
jgi:hypothetical protein